MPSSASSLAWPDDRRKNHRACGTGARDFSSLVSAALLAALAALLAARGGAWTSLLGVTARRLIFVSLRLRAVSDAKR
jgi:hypothetical protein